MTDKELYNALIKIYGQDRVERAAAEAETEDLA